MIQDVRYIFGMWDKKENRFIPFDDNAILKQHKNGEVSIRFK